MSKYHNTKVTINGITFDSKKEAARYVQLSEMQDNGLITDLQLQVPFVLQPSFIDADGHRQRPIKYVADFVYMEDGKKVIEDVKSAITLKNPVYRLKKKMLLYRGYKIREV